MYSILVTGDVQHQVGGAFTMDGSRYLEHTEAAIATQLRPLSRNAIECLKSWPCLLMTEGRTTEIAYVARILDASVSGGGVKLTTEVLPSSKQIINDVLWKLRAELDIGQFEFNRHHIAVKNRDLISVLATAGYQFEGGAVAQFTHRPLPAPSRLDLVESSKKIAQWGHADIDQFLLEVGVTGLDAPRTLGGRKERATAIVQFAINNPSAVTAENELLSALIVERTKSGGPSNGPTLTAIGPTEFGPAIASPKPAAEVPGRVFVVHGRNEAARKELVGYLVSLGLEAIVLHEQPNMGQHLLTKFIREARVVSFAVVLMTDDDQGAARGEQLRSRARQNVILELGYFLSHLGQAKVCAIKTPGLETPSDFDGIAYISMDKDGNWKVELLRELKAASVPVNEKGAVKD